MRPDWSQLPELGLKDLHRSGEWSALNEKSDERCYGVQIIMYLCADTIRVPMIFKPTITNELYLSSVKF